MYSARSPHSPEPCLWKDQNLAKNLWKGSPKEHSCEIILKSDKRFQRRRFLKNCLKNLISLPWQPEFWMESNPVNKFWRGPPSQVWSKLAQRFGRRRCLKKLLTTHDGWRTPHHPKSSPRARCAVGKNPENPCDSNPGPLDYKSNTLPPSHAGPQVSFIKQEGQNGPGSLTWFFEIALANLFFFLLSEKNLQEFLYVCTVQEASIH